MKKIHAFGVILVLAITLVSCSTLTMVSNKQADYTGQPHKIYIAVNCTSEGKSFCTGLANGLETSFAQKKIESQIYVRDPLALENDADINKKINDYNPDAVLLIRQTVTGESVGTFELTLVDGQTKKNVWKAQLDIAPGQYSSVGDYSNINKGIKLVMEKLAEDKIVP